MTKHKQTNEIIKQNLLLQNGKKEKKTLNIHLGVSCFWVSMICITIVFATLVYSGYELDGNIYYRNILKGRMRLYR